MLPFLEQHFPVAKTAENRALAGDSLAATVSLYTAIQYPEIFGKVMLHSPYVDQDVFQMIENYTKWERLTIYHVIGRKETAVKMTDGEVADFLSMNRKLSQVLQQKKLSYFYNEFDGDHTWKYWQKT